MLGDNATDSGTKNIKKKVRTNGYQFVQLVLDPNINVELTFGLPPVISIFQCSNY